MGILGPSHQGIAQEDRFSQVAEFLVHRVHENVESGRGVLSGDHHALPPVLRQVLGHHLGLVIGPRAVLFRRDAAHPGHPQMGRHGQGEGLQLGGRQGEAMVRHGTGRAGSALGHVEAVHLGVVLPRAPLRHEIAGVTHAGRALGEKIALQRQHDLRLREVVSDREILTECPSSALTGQIRAGGLPLDEAGLGQGLLQAAHLSHQGRRDQGRRHHGQPGPLQGTQGVQGLLHLAAERVPAAGNVQVERDLRAIGIVELQDRGLREEIGATEARRMLGITLDLGGTPHVALDQQTDGESGARLRHGGREIETATRDDFLGLLYIGNDLLQRLAATGVEPGQGQGGTHELQKAAP